MGEVPDRVGRYELVRRLGRGGNADVWEAVLVGIGGFRKAVALKLLRRAPAPGKDPVALIREARLGALLQHPNVVGTWELGRTEDGTWFIAMELVRGDTVAAIARRGQLSPAAIVDVGEQVCAGLAHVHALRVEGRDAGLVHRDVKGSNLLVDRTGLVKLADLGVATLGGDEVAGTPSHMAPEQADGRAEQRSDLWGLGVVLYSLAAGRRPFGAGWTAMARANRVEDRLAEPAFLAPVEACLEGLADVVRRCLRRDPRDRWESAIALREGLAALQPDGAHLVDLLGSQRPDLVLEGRGALPTPSSVVPTLTAVRGNLPAARDRFFGRTVELAEVEDHIHGSGVLLTLLGPGGMGKTRLALAAAQRAGPLHVGGGWFFDLSEADTLDEVCAVLAHGMSIELEVDDPVAQIGRVIAGRGRAVVILDNLEQLVALAPDTVARWIDLAPEARFLCTSRRRLGLRGEKVLALGALDVDAGVALFADRCPAPADGSRAEVAALVEALEGMPLAIELAAARTRLLSVAEVRRRLDDRLRLLRGGDRDRPARQRSVQASLDASWELLPAHGRAALAQLSLFEGGFRLEAAEAVLDLGDVDLWALDAVQELVDSSLVRVASTGERFVMLQVVRAYAARRLDDAARAGAERRHGHALAQLGSQAALELRTASPADLDDLVAACQRAVARGDMAVAVPTCEAAWTVLHRVGPFPLGLSLAESVLGLALAPAARVRVARVAGDAAYLSGRPEQARQHLEEALTLAVEVGDRRGEAGARGRLGLWHLDRSELDSAADQLERSLALHRARGDRNAEGGLLANLGNLAQKRGQVSDARDRFEEALTVLREVGDRRTEGSVLGNLGVLALNAGRIDEAVDLFDRALAANREAGDGLLESTVRGNLAVLHLQQGRLPEARAMFEAVLVANRALGNRRREAVALANIGVVCCEQGDIDQARVQQEAALAIYRELGDRESEGVTLSNLAGLAGLQGRFDAATTLYEQALAVHRETGARHAEGNVRAGLGELALQAGQLADARAHHHAAVAVFRDVGDRRAEGGTGLLLARVCVAEGRTDEALDHLRAGEDLLRDVGDALELARLLLSRAEILHGTGDADGAAAALVEAEAIVGGLELSAESALAQAIGDVRQLLGR